MKKAFNFFITLLTVSLPLSVVVFYGIKPIFVEFRGKPGPGVDNTAAHTLKLSPDDESPQITLSHTDLCLFCQDGSSNKSQIAPKSCQIEAEESKIFPQKQITSCKRVVCTLKTNNDHVATIKAPEAHIDHEKKQIFFPGESTGSFNGAGNPIGGTTDSWNVTKQDACYDEKNHTITAKHTKVTSGAKVSIEADSSVIHVKDKTILLENNVVSRFDSFF